MAVNLDNFGIINGTLQADPTILTNQDGSKKVLMIVNVSDMTRDTNGNRTFQQIPVQAFIPKTYNGIGPYKYLHQNDEVHIEYILKSNLFQNEINLIVQIDTIKFGKDVRTPSPNTTKLIEEIETPQEKPETKTVQTEPETIPATTKYNNQMEEDELQFGQ